MLASHYADIRFIHVGCVALSGSLFTVRGLFRIGNFAVANHWLLRVTSYIIDSTLLASAILLTLGLRQYPFVDSWLTAKVLLLVLYIALGNITLKGAHTRLGRMAALLGSLVTFVAIIGVAIAHHPAGWLRQKEQREQRQNPGVFVTGSSQPDVFNDAVIDAQQ